MIKGSSGKENFGCAASNKSFKKGSAMILEFSRAEERKKARRFCKVENTLKENELTKLKNMYEKVFDAQKIIFF